MQRDCEPTAQIFDIKRDCSEDGPGIRTTVFFKGCPLSCVWCQNPEGKERAVELSYTSRACHPLQCGAPCLVSCGENSIALSGAKIAINRDSCRVCNKCSEACPTAALELTGYSIGLEALLYRLLIDKPFYSSSGGGVTLSGGEVTQQMVFAHQLLKALKAEGVHTAIETSGFFNYSRFETLLMPWLDLIYFDLKLIDDAESRRYTGHSNQQVLDNFSTLVERSEVPVIPRVPLIPGITTSEKNLSGIAGFLADHGIDSATLLPYNPLWGDKADKLGIAVKYPRTTFMTPLEKRRCVTSFQTSHQIERGVSHAN
ncbi:MAG: glycyl-radical enzyme activating protein [Candidatus Polarisedimenticolaceae bacterium]|nr:glycyl-radical enzyme activating protein [Candidatus Polarisedimenticolaceae bacterium]